MPWTVAVLKLSFDAYAAGTTLWLAAFYSYGFVLSFGVPRLSIPRFVGVDIQQ